MPVVYKHVKVEVHVEENLLYVSYVNCDLFKQSF